MKLEKAFVLILIVFMFALPFSYSNARDSQEIKYENWAVDFFIDDIIRYSTNGLNVNGHIFGWTIRPGSCNTPVLYLSISTYKTNAEHLNDKLKGKIVPLIVSFPGITKIPETEKIKTDFISALDYAPILTVAAFSHFFMNPGLDLRMSELKKIKIEVDSPHSDLFDIVSDVYDLNGYIEAKQRAYDICEQHLIQKLAFNQKLKSPVKRKKM